MLAEFVNKIKKFVGRANPRSAVAEYEVHIHEGAAIENPREHCPQCKAMTEEEYRAWLADKSPWVKVIEIHRA